MNSILTKTKKRCPRGYRVNKNNKMMCHKKQIGSKKITKNKEWNTFMNSVANTKFTVKKKSPIKVTKQTQMSHFYTKINI